MTPSSWIGLGALLLLIGFVVFAFRRSVNIRRDEKRRLDDWLVAQGGSDNRGSGDTNSTSLD
jgi:hypothetical protein